jgi:hypothetical protein
MPMTLKQARDILGDRPTWELKNMKKALESLGGFFNTDEENERLEAVNIVLKEGLK